MGQLFCSPPEICSNLRSSKPSNEDLVSICMNDSPEEKNIQKHSKSVSFAVQEISPIRRKLFPDDPPIFFDNGKDESFDKESIVFKGTRVEQKAANRIKYEFNTIWIDLKTHTFHMSPHVSKVRRHIEAPLSEIGTLRVGAPHLLHDSLDPMKIDQYCFSILFRSGGGVDLQFSCTQDRDTWLTTLSLILHTHHQNQLPQQPHNSPHPQTT